MSDLTKYQIYDLLNRNCEHLWLAGIDLSEVNLIWVDLSKAILCSANLSGANLTLADLSGANLINANLTDANLTEADLSKANLLQAKVAISELVVADSLAGTKMPDGADLSEEYWEADFESWQKKQEVKEINN